VGDEEVMPVTERTREACSTTLYFADLMQQNLGECLDLLFALVRIDACSCKSLFCAVKLSGKRSDLILSGYPRWALVLSRPISLIDV
jgi:hypothetical protein